MSEIINIHDKFEIADERKVMEMVINLTAEQYTCNRPPGAAGAALISGTKILFAGVRPPLNSPTCKEVGCEIEYSIDVIDTAENPQLSEMEQYIHPHCVRTIHAEQRLIADAARHGISTDGTTVFSILKPCYQCSKMLIAAGVRIIYYAGQAYDEERTRVILENAGVRCEKLDINLGY